MIKENEREWKKRMKKKNARKRTKENKKTNKEWKREWKKGNKKRTRKREWKKRMETKENEKRVNNKKKKKENGKKENEKITKVRQKKKIFIFFALNTKAINEIDYFLWWKRKPWNGSSNSQFDISTSPLAVPKDAQVLLINKTIVSKATLPSFSYTNREFYRLTVAAKWCDIMSLNVEREKDRKVFFI